MLSHRDVEKDGCGRNLHPITRNVKHMFIEYSQNMVNLVIKDTKCMI